MVGHCTMATRVVIHILTGNRGHTRLLHTLHGLTLGNARRVLSNHVRMTLRSVPLQCHQCHRFISAANAYLPGRAALWERGSGGALTRVRAHVMATCTTDVCMAAARTWTHGGRPASAP